MSLHIFSLSRLLHSYASGKSNSLSDINNCFLLRLLCWLVGIVPLTLLPCCLHWPIDVAVFGSRFGMQVLRLLALVVSRASVTFLLFLSAFLLAKVVDID
jgi:hypothetical protein